jgi:nitrile hydratase subunit beta
VSAPRFKIGERVKVMKAYPLGHIRTPYYIRGCTGEVERLCGMFANPEELAQMRSGEPKQPLYRVRFRQKDVWPDYRGPESDVVEVEIYQHWLDAA